MKLILLFLLIIIGGLRAEAQVTVRGEVCDSVTNAPLAGANVSFRRGGKTLKFVRTDQRGLFAITVDTLRKGDLLQATLMGYKKQSVEASREKVRIGMPSQAFQLREVKVQGVRVHGRDTITYDLTQFANDRDNSLKDVLRKLPGVDIADNGKISYNGKDIHRFTVEGLDLTNGRYNQLTENIRAKDVKKAEIVEHDQPIKALQDRTYTDNVGMNVQLKDEARDRLTFTLRPYLLYGDEFAAGGSVNVMQIGKKKQRMYDAAYDNSGRRLSSATDRLAAFSTSLPSMSLPIWHSQMSLQAPLDAERLRFNDSQHYAVNNIRKGKNDSEWRVNARYTREQTDQSIENVSMYNISDGEPVVTRQNRDMHLATDKLSAELEYRMNTKEKYGNRKFAIDASRGFGIANYGGDMWQAMRTPQIGATYSNYVMKPLKTWQMWWKSTCDLHVGGDVLNLPTEKHEMQSTLYHSNKELEFSKKTGFVTQNYNLGFERYHLWTRYSPIDGRPSYGISNREHYQAGYFDVSFAPAINYRKEVWYWSLSVPTHLERFMQQQRTWLHFSPYASLSYKPGNRNEYFLSAAYGESASALGNYVMSEYRKDYRTMWQGADFVPTTRSMTSSLRWNYKRPIYEIFANARVVYAHTWADSRTDMTISDDGNYLLKLVKDPSESDAFTAMGGVSKGFYKLHLKASLDASASLSKGSQRSAGQVFNYTGRTFSATPGIEWSPSWAAFSYSAMFTKNISHTIGRDETSLLNIRQELSATATIGRVDLSYSLVAHRNELQQGNKVDALLSDAIVVWRLKRVRLSAELRNIFDKRMYTETTYSGVLTSTTVYQLRPRELMLTAQFSL